MVKTPRQFLQLVCIQIQVGGTETAMTSAGLDSMFLIGQITFSPCGGHSVDPAHLPSFRLFSQLAKACQPDTTDPFPQVQMCSAGERGSVSDGKPYPKLTLDQQLGNCSKLPPYSVPDYSLPPRGWITFYQVSRYQNLTRPLYFCL